MNTGLESLKERQSLKENRVSRRQRGKKTELEKEPWATTEVREPGSINPY